MKLSDVSKVLSFTSFRPDPDDGSFSWKKRFTKRKSLLLNLSRDGVAWRAVSREGALTEIGFIQGPLKDVLQEMSDEFSAMTDNGWCAVSVNQRYVITLEKNLTRKDLTNDVLRVTPRSVLGAKAERGKRYSLAHNPESNTSALLSVDEEYIKEIEGLFKASGLKLGRICCGVFAMLDETLNQIQLATKEYKDENAKDSLGGILSVISCNGSVCILKTEKEKWTELRSRVALFTEDDIAPLEKILLPMVNDLREGDRIVLNACEEGSQVRKLLRGIAPSIKINDISRSAAIWNLMSKY